jgi:hypothetical protein
VAAQVGHEDVTTTNRIYRYVLQRRQRGEIGRHRQLEMHESAAGIEWTEYLPDRSIRPAARFRPGGRDRARFDLVCPSCGRGGLVPQYRRSRLTLTISGGGRRGQVEVDRPE